MNFEDTSEFKKLADILIKIDSVGLLAVIVICANLIRDKAKIEIKD